MGDQVNRASVGVIPITRTSSSLKGMRRVKISSANEEGLPGGQLSTLDLDRYMENPVVLWQHDQYQGIPIGRTESLEFDSDGSLVANFRFLPDDEFASRVKNAWDKGFLNAASVGWVYKDAPHQNNPELLEWSIVSIPKDSKALKAGYEALLKDSLHIAKETNVEPENKVTEMTQEQFDELVNTQVSQRLSMLLALQPLLGENLASFAGKPPREILLAAAKDVITEPESRNDDFLQGALEVHIASVAKKTEKPGINTNPNPGLHMASHPGAATSKGSGIIRLMQKRSRRAS